MKFLILVFCLSSSVSFAANKDSLTEMAPQLTLEGATQIAKQAQMAAQKLNKTVSIAVVGSQGETILIFKGDGVGPHNTEAARRKAYTSLSTKTPTLLLLRKAKESPDTTNLAELPELLLLSGGHPLWKDGAVIGAIGIAGGGSPENDDLIASQAGVSLAGISTKK
nr:heme-binding protein [Bacteriovorax sp. HI3]